MRAAALVLLAAVGCGGAPFGHDSPTGDDLAGAPSSAGSIGTGGSVMPAGGHAGASSGGSKAEGGGGSGSSGAAAVPEGGEGGAGGVAGGSGGSSTSTGGLPSCLPGWEGSSCDTCTNSPAIPGGQTCAEMLTCFIEKSAGHRSPPGDCYEKPTADATAQVAHDVFYCRCP